MCDSRPEIRAGQTEIKSFQGFGKRQTSYTKISAPPGGHTQLNLFGNLEDDPQTQEHKLNKCQYERNRSTITDQYIGQDSPVEEKSPTIEHALPAPKKPATKVIQPPGGKTSLSLFG